MGQPSLMRESEIDAQTIEACKRGDRAAFQLLFETYKDRVYSVAFHFCGDEAMADDATQQVFLKLFSAIDQFRQDAQFTTWLYRIVVNTCVDEQRKRKRFVPFSPEVEVKNLVARSSQEESYSRRQVAASVKAAIANLSPKLRLPILLKYVEDLSYEEIAEAIGCSKGTVASRLNRGHKSLARKLAFLRDEVSAGK
jgi:RNA polymerase sigma-70 factor (ECF subfamily)